MYPLFNPLKSSKNHFKKHNNMKQTTTPTANTINIEEITKTTREFNCNEILDYFRMHTYLFWSWGATNFSNYKDKAFKFKVNGHYHKGCVYIVLNGLDLFDVYLTSTKGVIKETINDVYIDQLFNLLDERIEKLPQYKQ
jgi:hypothetical protein